MGVDARALLSAIGLPAWLIDAETKKILGVNDAFASLVKRPVEALTGGAALELVDPQDRVREGLRLGLQLGSPLAPEANQPGVTRLVVHGGPSLRVRFTSTPVPAVRPHGRLLIAHEIGADERAMSSSTKDATPPPRPSESGSAKVDATKRPAKIADAARAGTEPADNRDERWRTLFDLCPAPTCVYDLASLQIHAVNEAMVRLYGFDRDELLAMTILDLVAPSDVDLVNSIVEELRRGQWPGVLHHPQTIRHRRKDGGELDTELIAAPVSYGDLRARLVLHKDVTEQKRAESDLVKRARIDAFRGDLGAAMTADEPLPAHFDRVVKAMAHHLDLESVGVWVRDEVTHQLHLQASVGALDRDTARGAALDFGDAWIGRAASSGAPVLLDMWDPAMSDDEVAQAQKACVTHVAALPLVVRKRVLGVITASRSSAFPDELVDILGATAAQIAQALGTAFAYEALRISESLSRSVLGNMPTAVVTINKAGLIETANLATVATFGHAVEELEGRAFATLFATPEADVPALAAQSRGRGLAEWKGLRKSGERFPCELRIFQIDSLRGPGYAAILNDVSERYEVERLKAEFVSVVSHELRTPLTALRGSILLLRGGVLGPLSEEVMEMLHIAERNSQRLMSLVNDILDLERLHKGKMKLFIEPVHAHDIVGRSLDSVKPSADQAGITIDVLGADEVVLGDGDRLVQVLVNLLSNAVKFSPPGSPVIVTTEVEHDAVVFSVIDKGRGIPPSHKRAIFERFEQVYASDAAEKGGTGLGLAISKAIVEQHDGTIGVESQEGAGSTFWFRVPRALASKGKVTPPSSRPRD